MTNELQMLDHQKESFKTTMVNHKESKAYDNRLLGVVYVNLQTIKWMVFVLVIIYSLISCQSKPNIFIAKEGFSGKEKVLVLPFVDLTKTRGEEGIIRCPLSGSFFVAGEVTTEAPETLTRYLKDYLYNETDFKLIYGKTYLENQYVSSSKNVQFYSERELILRAGNAEKVEAVIVGYIFRYKERVGNSYSVKSPASIAFGIHMLKVPEGQSIWFGHFDETQHSLSENLFKIGTFIKRHASWITADEMAQTGLKEMLKELLKK